MSSTRWQRFRSGTTTCLAIAATATTAAVGARVEVLDPSASHGAEKPVLRTG